jgi:hypothetical protein
LFNLPNPSAASFITFNWSVSSTVPKSPVAMRKAGPFAVTILRFSDVYSEVNGTIGVSRHCGRR